MHDDDVFDVFAGLFFLLPSLSHRAIDYRSRPALETGERADLSLPYLMINETKRDTNSLMESDDDNRLTTTRPEFGFDPDPLTRYFTHS